MTETGLDSITEQRVSGISGYGCQGGAFTLVRFSKASAILVTGAMPEGGSRAAEQQSRAEKQQSRRAAEHAGRDIGSRQESMAAASASELEVMQQLETGLLTYSWMDAGHQ